ELVDPLGHVVRLGESAAVQPCEGVAHLETSGFDRDGETMPGARPTECPDVPAGREYPVARFGPVRGGGEAVPYLAHESQAAGRGGDDWVNGCGWHSVHCFDAVAVVDGWQVVPSFWPE